MRKGISLLEESYWKLLKVKAELRADTWDDLVNKIYDMVFRDEKNE
mgnify:CR=1 FL=1